jgi:phage tail sheath protein FI
MPVTLTYPGVYIQELPSGTRAITGVATSVTAFVGRAWRGPVDAPTAIASYADFQRQFGGLWRASTLGYAVQQFFTNGGNQAVIVRVATREAHDGFKVAAAATIDLGGGTVLSAANAGTWGRNLLATVDYHTKDEQAPTPDENLFNLTVLDDPDTKADAMARGGSGVREAFLNVSIDPASPRFVTSVLAQQSQLVRISTLGNARPAAAEDVGPATTSGDDGGDVLDSDVVGADDDPPTGMYTLRKTDLFNLLCIPPLTPGATGNDIATATWVSASALCNDRRAFLIVDAPGGWTITTAIDTDPANTGIGAFSSLDRNHAAIYFPRVLIPDPLQENKLEAFAPCGVVAGIMSRTDSARGVWKAPAGIEANLMGVLGLSIASTAGTLTDNDVGRLNPLGINSLRGLPVIGHVVWGARTLEGADVLASQWKYIPVRRLALFIEESLFRGTQWVVFEPNDEPLWAQIRLNVGAFMQTLFQQGAFQGSSPKDAYFVKCSSETTTQTDIDNGIVNIVVGFAPLKPAEFVVIQIQQITPQS